MRMIIEMDQQDITYIGMKSLIHDLVNDDVLISRVKDRAMLIQILTENPDAFVILDYALSDFTSPDQLLNISTGFTQSHWLLFSEELSDSFLKQILFNSQSFSVVLKSCELEEINLAVKLGLNNKCFICREVTNQIILSSKSMSVTLEERLTLVEREILKEIALGKTTKEVASNRNLSFHTIITHRKNIFRKLEVNNIHEATKYAIRAGIVDLAEYYI